jgi:hypothetical protein
MLIVLLLRFFIRPKAKREEYFLPEGDFIIISFYGWWLKRIPPLFWISCRFMGLFVETEKAGKFIGAKHQKKST